MQLHLSWCRFCTSLAALTGLAVIAACGDDAASRPDAIADVPSSFDTTPDADPDDATVPATLLDNDLRLPGPFRVGYRTFDHTYTPPDGPARTIRIHLWYPTEATSGPNPTYAGIFEDTDAIVDAPLAPPVESAGYPLHVHSHGHLGFAATSSFMMRHFASHGWVAAAPDHTGNTIVDNIDPRPVAIYFLRPADISATLDALADLPRNDALAGRLRTERVLLSGHSFGAHTCWAAAGATFDAAAIDAGCAEGGTLAPCTSNEKAVFAAGLGDPRIAAILPMAGTIRRELHGPTGHAAVTTPILALSGSNDPVGAEDQFATTTALDLTWVELAGGCHQTFALGACDTLETAEGFAIVNTFALGFARAHILGDTAPATLTLLDGSASLSAKVTVKVQTP
jgi:predicted dienelactone hydrolase